MVAEKNTKHGLAKRGLQAREYKSWAQMIQRCLNQNNPNFKDYGARGIAVSDRWRSFENFFADMGKRPKGKTIERIDNDGNYEVSNCRWATPKEQAQNRRTAIWVESQGKRMRLTDWAAILGITYSSIHKRFTKGTWPN